jgi:antitoxin YefM
MLKNTISITEARKKIFDIADEVQKPNNFYTLTERGKPKAVILSAEEFDSIAETIQVMQEFPNLKKDIEEAEKEYAKGDYITLDQLLVKEGYVVADKSKNKYGVKKYAVPSRGAKKSAKRAK